MTEKCPQCGIEVENWWEHRCFRPETKTTEELREELSNARRTAVRSITAMEAIDFLMECAWCYIHGCSFSGDIARCDHCGQDMRNEYSQNPAAHALIEKLAKWRSNIIWE